MNYRCCGIFIFTWFVITVSGQSDFAAHTIADSLREEAHAVYRFHHTRYDRTSDEKYTATFHYAVTILNKKGKNAAALTVHYDRNAEVKDIKGTRFDTNGKVVGSLKKKEIKDYASNNSFTLFSDNRVKYFAPVINTYPCTIEYEYTIEHDGIVGFDTWMPLQGYHTSVEKATLTFKTPIQSDIKYLALNHDFIFKENIGNSYKAYFWSADNLKPLKRVPNAPHRLDFMPSVLLSPNEIKYEKTVGDFSSWNTYGKWVSGLLEGRDELPAATVKYIKALTDTIETTRGKTKAIYNHMQNKTRYVNIALGIGGFQPRTAKEVDQNGYGDCKALSNYTKSLLKAAGIKSYYAEIGSGSLQELKFTDFASANQTNHIIVCVPDATDTIWLECTSQNIPFGYIGAGNLNRYALLINDDGGHLARTPNYTATDNSRTARINIKLSPKGSAEFHLAFNFKNYCYESIFGLTYASKKEQKDRLLKTLTTDGLKITDFSIKEVSNQTAEGLLTVNGQINRFATKAGSRIILLPNYFLKTEMIGLISAERTVPVYQPLGTTIIDSFHINIPIQHVLEYLPENQSFNSDYGNYQLTYHHQANAILITRKLQINEGTYQRSSFSAINKFVKKVKKAEEEKIIFIKNKHPRP